jgi:futalosine hydrolase
MTQNNAMSFKILYVTATSSEAESLESLQGIVRVSGGYRYGNFNIDLLVTGVGSVATIWAMTKWISLNTKPDLAINAGIAGSYKDDIMIGDIVMPVSECFADAGIEDGEDFLTLTEAGLSKADDFPFRNGLLNTDKRYSDRMKSILKPARAITVNTATGSETTKGKMLKKFNPDIETMEGAAFFYICIHENMPFMAMRAISNRIEPRNISNWNIPFALQELSKRLKEVLEALD